MDYVLGGLVLLIIGIVSGLFYARTEVYFLNKRISQLTDDKKALQDKLDQASHLRDQLISISKDAILVCQPEGEHRILFANPAAEKLLGYGLLNKPVTSVTQNDDLNMLLTEIYSPEDGDIEQLLDFKGRMLRARVTTLLELEKPVQVLTMRDETEFIRLMRARREMVANISHELRTPITAISLIADTLLGDETAIKKSKNRKMVKNIKRQIDHLAQLVQEMRDLSLIESGQMPVKLMPTPLLPIIQASIDPLLSLSEDKQQTISVGVPEDCLVLADFQQAQRVIKNIVHNAIKFAPVGGSIKINAQVNDNHEEMVISIWNNGPSISQEHLPRIFERFYQADRARSDGTGLGLAIARHIILSHGGRIWAASEAGDGTTFFFTLPLAEDIPV
ncbi:MAG: PAS domain-containing protein [Anaerolineae bacterium]|nr:MAG: PAS domain-containing protein [Anaerolineae bacterium]MCL4877597.1 PAS domain-containing protein [Anaerolineae bacterium]